MLYGERVRTGLMRRMRWALIPMLLVALAATGCSVGAYPIDYFQEMHYSQAFRTQEDPKPRPEGAVVFRGAGVGKTVEVAALYDTKPFAEMAAVKNPVAKDAAAMKRALELYRINCSGCHGQRGRGVDDTPKPLPAILFQAATIDGVKVQPPANFATDELATKRTEGELFWIITRGTANIPNKVDGRGNMPSFRKFLTVEDRWTLVHMVLECRTGGSYCPKPGA